MSLVVDSDAKKYRAGIGVGKPVLPAGQAGTRHIAFRVYAAVVCPQDKVAAAYAKFYIRKPGEITEFVTTQSVA